MLSLRRSINPWCRLKAIRYRLEEVKTKPWMMTWLSWQEARPKTTQMPWMSNSTKRLRSKCQTHKWLNNSPSKRWSRSRINLNVLLIWETSMRRNRLRFILMLWQMSLRAIHRWQMSSLWLSPAYKFNSNRQTSKAKNGSQLLTLLRESQTKTCSKRLKTTREWSKRSKSRSHATSKRSKISKRRNLISRWTIIRNWSTTSTRFMIISKPQNS